VDTHSKITALSDWTADITTMTGLFYDSGRLYFTKSGSSTLYYRYFTPENKIVGAQRLTASANVTGIDFSQVRGMFVAGANLYWSTPSNDLRRIGWAQGAQSGTPVAGAATVVSSPAVDGYSWGSPRALFLFQDKDGDGPSAAPTAAYTQTCTSLSCTFDSSGSTTSSGTITGRSWTFGDGTTSTEANPVHAFPATGTYQVGLTVTTSKGLSNTVTKTVQVTRVNQDPTADFTATCNQLTCTFNAGGSADADGTVAGYAWSFGDGATGTGNPATRTYASAGTRDVTLTVTDNEGGTGTVTKSVKSSQASVGFVAAASTNSNGRATHTVAVPAGVQAGDTLLAFLTVNSSTATFGAAPAGWTEVQAANVDGLQGRVWSRTATASDAGSTVSVTTSASIKSSMTVAAYRPSAGSTMAVTASAKTTSAAAATQLTTPQVAVTEPGSWLVSYWGVKSSEAVSFSTPAAEQVRSTSVSTATSGSISGRLTDSGQPVAAGSRGGVSAGTGGSTSRAAMFSVVVAAQ
ncbi:MAG: PKD domain-containing protein, partial [Marmoricola sp.]